jgi:hypothetical protein
VRAKLIQELVQPLHREVVGEFLGAFEVVDIDEYVVQELETDLPFAEFAGEPVMPGRLKLLAVGSPGGHTHVPQAELLVDEIEVLTRLRLRPTSHVTDNGAFSG